MKILKNLFSSKMKTYEPGEEIVDIDGNRYKTVKIGNQVWMAENLKVTHYRNGDPIPNVTDNTEWEKRIFLTTGAYCDYGNDFGNVATYGRLYNWYAVDDSRNIDPAGWHVPTDDEWKQLEMYLGMSQSQADLKGYRGTNEGSKLAGNASLWASSDLKNNRKFGTSGFTAFPAGYRNAIGNFNYLGSQATFWSSTGYISAHSDTAGYRYLGHGGAQVGRVDTTRQNGFSVRCVRDN